jgi:hypothetical protein
MAGYATSARIGRTTPRFRLGHAPDGSSQDVSPPSLEELSDGTGPSVDEVSGRGFAADLVELLADIRDVWRQGREVLADPQGWRVGL